MGRRVRIRHQPKCAVGGFGRSGIGMNTGFMWYRILRIRTRLGTGRVDAAVLVDGLRLAIHGKPRQGRIKIELAVLEHWQSAPDILRDALRCHAKMPRQS